MLLTACGAKQRATTAPTQGNERVIVVGGDSSERTITDTLRLGRMRSGEIIAQAYRIQNDSGEPIVLSHHRVSCGCLSVEYDRKPIATGQSAEMVLEFDSRTMMGLQLKTLNLFLAEQSRPIRIFVEAEVE